MSDYPKRDGIQPRQPGVFGGADFDDLVARVNALAMDEAVAALERGATGGRGTYPPAGLIAEAKANLLLHLWEVVMAAPAGGPYRAPGSGAYYTIELPAGGEYRADIRQGTVGEYLRATDRGGLAATMERIGDQDVLHVPVTPRDPIHDAIEATQKPGRANE